MAFICICSLNFVSHFCFWNFNSRGKQIFDKTNKSVCLDIPTRYDKNHKNCVYNSKRRTRALTIRTVSGRCAYTRFSQAITARKPKNRFVYTRRRWCRAEAQPIFVLVSIRHNEGDKPVLVLVNRYFVDISRLLSA